MLEKMLAFGRLFIPAQIFRLGQPVYHYILALIATLWYRFPARSIKIVLITGTKGKSTTVEIVNSILETAGMRTALTSTIRTKIAENAYPNLYKMTTPGRFFLQKFLRQAVETKCEWVVIEMTSQAIAQYRHKFIPFEALIFTGVHPEHIEAHGSFDKYLAAKLELAHALNRSNKYPRIAVSNLDDTHGKRFLSHEAEKKVGFHLADWSKYNYKTELPGDFNKRNILAAASFARAIGIKEGLIKKGVANLKHVPGRMEFVQNNLGIEIVVDYAHTTGSLEEVYKLFKGQHTICVLGACGGGRDKWKRPLMGGIAESYCSEIILTNEDPYDENPKTIVDEIANGIADKSKYKIEIDRRKAISKALQLAFSFIQIGNQNPVILITGKGTDPYIMGPHATKLSWSDKLVTEEELAKLIKNG